MKKILVILLMCSMAAGCSDRKEVESLQGELQALEQAGQADLEACRQDNAAKDEDIAQLERKISYFDGFISSLLNIEKEKGTTSRSQDVWEALQLDFVVDERDVSAFVVGNLKTRRLRDYRFSGMYDRFDEMLRRPQLNAPPKVFNRQQVMKICFTHIKSIFNDKGKLTYYYETFKQPVLLAFLDYNRQATDKYEAINYLERVRDHFASLLNPEILETLHTLVQKEEELIRLRLGDASPAKVQAVRKELGMAKAKLNYSSVIMFAYRRYVQSGNDRELIELYVHMFDEFLGMAKKAMTMSKANGEGHNQPPGQELTVVTPGEYPPETRIKNGPSGWYGLYRTESGLVLKKIDLMLTKKTIDGAFGVYDALDISAPGKERPLLLLKGADWLVEGPIDVFLEHNTYLSPTVLNKKPYTIFEQADGLKIEVIDPLLKVEAIKALGYHNLGGTFELWVSCGRRAFKVNRFYNPHFMFFNVYWVADLDRDGVPDFMTSADVEGKSHSYRYLYLSGAAKDGDLFGEITIVSPDGGGC